MSQLGPILEGARTRAALSQGARAVRRGVSQQTVSRWEQGLSRPRPQLITKLAEILNLDAAELTAAAGQTQSPTASAGRTDGPIDDTAPMRSLTSMLPLQRLTAEEF